MKEKLIYHTPYEDYNVKVKIGAYTNNGCLAVLLSDAETGEQVTCLSVNLEDKAQNGYMYLDNEYGQGEWGIRFLEENNLGSFTGMMIPQGFAVFPLMKMNLRKLLDIADNTEIAEEVLNPMIAMEEKDGVSV